MRVLVLGTYLLVIIRSYLHNRHFFAEFFVYNLKRCGQLEDAGKKVRAYRYRRNRRVIFLFYKNYNYLFTAASRNEKRIGAMASRDVRVKLVDATAGVGKVLKNLSSRGARFD